jgi:peptidoglycan/LPS O-acetylase OafA/YrhL
VSEFTLGYRKSLDGLRGIAVLAVVLSHMPQLEFLGGFFGVDLFFVLSGFLITSLLLEEWRARGDISLKAFYARRALRLLPALVEVLLVAVVFSALKEPPAEAEAMRSAALITLGYSANWFVAFRCYPRQELAHTWSLSVEEQFYVLWPFVLLMMLKLNLSRRTIGGILVALLLGSAALRAYLWLTTRSWERVYYGSDTHADGLLAGALVALMMFSGVRPQTALGTRLLNWVAHGMMVFLGFYFVRGWAADPMLSVGGYLALNLGAAAVVMCLVCSPWAPLRFLCEMPALVWVGRISYGVYLWHAVIFWMLRVRKVGLPGPSWVLPIASALAVASVVAVAAVSFYVLERPLLRLKRRFERVESARP